jgi:hypothetical protein
MKAVLKMKKVRKKRNNKPTCDYRSSKLGFSIYLSRPFSSRTNSSSRWQRTFVDKSKAKAIQIVVSKEYRKLDSDQNS